jgi:indolepyruvate ferredoxin oxidoreductase beta subunit
LSRFNGSSINVKNVVFAGLGGHGVLKASDIAATAALLAGYDVKKSELHGMSQRGGSVSSDVRYGDAVLSPMVPSGEADFLVVIAPDQIEVNRWQLKGGGILIDPSLVDVGTLANKKSLNVALLGVLSAVTEIAEDCWSQAIRSHLEESLHDSNLAAFQVGRACAGKAFGE